VAGVSALGIAGLPAVAQASPVCAASGTTVTCAYTAVGSGTFVVPGGVTSLTITAQGGSGGDGFAAGSAAAGTGGLGAVATKTVTVTPGASLTVLVGGEGGNGTATAPGTGGFNGGAAGGASANSGGGGGGGASEVTSGGTALVVGGGGGGGGGAGASGGGACTSGTPTGGGGGNGGTSSGANGASAANCVTSTTNGGANGTGGSSSAGAGGSGGASHVTPAGHTGATAAAGAGGAGGGGGGTSSFGAGGGGGGGGLLGGGGGGGGGEQAASPAAYAGGGGGGGGASLGTTTALATAAGDGSVTIVYAGSLPTIRTASPLPGATVRHAYSKKLAAAGGVTPYTWSVRSGGLPAGLSLSAGGTISGTPTAVGTAHFTVKLTDTNGVTASKAFALAVHTRANLKIYLKHRGIFRHHRRGAYLIRVTNTGGSATTATTGVLLGLPRGLVTVRGGRGTWWQCHKTRHTSSCSRGAAIGAHSSTVIRVTVKVNARAGRTLFATASVSPSDNFSTDKVIIRRHSERRH
jgi:hypothetical protein